VRKWLKRFNQGNYQALDDLSPKPKHSPKAVSEKLAQYIVRLKAKYKCLGKEEIKVLENLSVSAKLYVRYVVDMEYPAERGVKNTLPGEI